VRCRPRSLKTMKWSRHSLRIEPMRKTVSDLLDVLDRMVVWQNFVSRVW